MHSNLKTERTLFLEKSAWTQSRGARARVLIRIRWIGMANAP